MEACLKIFSAKRLDFFINDYLHFVIFIFLFLTGFSVLAEKKCARVLLPIDQSRDLNEKYKGLTEKKKELDQYQPFPNELVHHLEAWFRVEMAYNSNAIEGNTLSRSETELAIGEGITSEGKYIREHLEVRNHAEAFDLIKRRIDEKSTFITLRDIRDIHSIILGGNGNNDVSRYRTSKVYIYNSEVAFPNYDHVVYLMEGFEQWLKESYNLHPVYRAAEAHYRFVSIHPFVDGNGRTARLLMNMILLMAGYPYTIIRVEDRTRYMRVLGRAQLYGLKEDFLKFIIEAVDRSLDIYLKTFANMSSHHLK